ncbi:MAG: hypothetical protein AAFY56_16855 [Pseudomonadota bacterium]
MSESKVKPEQRKSPTGQWLGFLGLLIIAIGIAPSVYMLGTDPRFIMFAGFGAMEFGAMESQDALDEALLAAWIFFFSPIVIICGTILITASAVIGALNRP